MIPRHRRGVRAASSLTLALILGAGIAPAAFAQGAPSGADNQQGEAADIIVTAQRRSERLQDVPIAISALGSEALSNTMATDIGALRASVPGLTISTSAGINASNLVSIRGVGGLAVPIGTSQATAFYVDGVYLSRPDAAFFSLDDVERVEVLRGPQGTLYGRNATAGAINIITREPGKDVKASFDLNTGNYEAVNVRGSVSGPLASGLYAGLSGSYDTRDGYYFNTVTDHRIGGERGYTVRGKLRFAPEGSNFTATLAGDANKRDGAIFIRNQYSAVTPGGVFIGVGDPDLIAIDAASEALSTSRTKGRGVSLTMTYGTGNIDLTSITAYRTIDTYIAYDVDGTAAPILITAIDNRGKTFSQELRGVYSSGPVNLTLGGNYYHEKASVGYASQSPFTPLLLTNPYTETTVDAYALFGQLEYEVLPRLTLVGGLRLNYETRDFAVDYSRAPTPGGIGKGNVSDTVLIPSVGVNFKADRHLLLYAKYGQGYQAPGYNGFVGLSSTSLVNTFGAEKLNAYEIGFKSQFFDNRVTFNAAAFYYDYSDLQVRSVFSTTRIVVNNAAAATIKGAEATVSVSPLDVLTLSGQATYLDATYNNFCEPITAGSPLAGDPTCADPTAADRSGNRLNQAPKWSGSVSADLHLPLGDKVKFKANASYTWESNIFYTPPNEPIVASGGWSRIDARVGVEVQDSVEFYVFGRNLTDKRYIAYSGRGSPLLAQAGLNDPRTYGVGLRYRY